MALWRVRERARESSARLASSRFLQVGVSGRVGRQVAYSSDLGRLLGLHSERRKSDADSENDRESGKSHAAGESSRTPDQVSQIPRATTPASPRHCESVATGPAAGAKVVFS